MNYSDAVNFLGLAGSEISADILKEAYRNACKKYHPDVNPAGLEMMQIINAAYDFLLDYDFGNSNTFKTESNSDYPEKLKDAISFAKTLEGCSLEICGVWLWVSGSTINYKEQLKENGFLWAPKKKLWYYRPAEYKRPKGTTTLTMDQIRWKYGTQTEETTQKMKIAQ